ncbi:MAG: sensor domain-containing diguanylate cyclase [Spirochaetota bacterium]
MKNMLDPATILVVGLSSLVVLGLAVFVVLRRRSLFQLHSWNIANAAGVLLFSLGLLWPYVQQDVLSFISSCLGMLAYAAFVYAAILLLGGKPPVRRWAAISGAALGGFALLTAFSAGRGLRVLVTSLAIALIFAEGAWQVRKHARRSRISIGPQMIVAVFALASCFFLARGLYHAYEWASPALTDGMAGLIDSLSLLIIVIIFMASDFALLVILMAGLEREVTGKVLEIGGSRNKLQILYDAFAETVGAVELDELVPRILDFIQSTLRIDALSLFIADAEGTALTLVGHRGMSDRAIHLISNPDLDRSITGRVFREAKAQFVAIDSYRPGEYREVLEAMGIGTLGSIPLGEPGHIVGTLTMGFRDSAAVDSDLIALLEDLGHQMGKVIGAATHHVELDRTNARLKELASTDTLTGLANRRAALVALDRELSRARCDGTKIAVLIADIDHFKRFNDLHGHECGDYVLEQTASVFSEAVRKSDLPARWGGGGIPGRPRRRRYEGLGDARRADTFADRESLLGIRGEVAVGYHHGRRSPLSAGSRPGLDNRAGG